MKGEGDLSRDAARLVERTTKAQGLPLRITDPVALRRIAAIIKGQRGTCPTCGVRERWATCPLWDVDACGRLPNSFAPERRAATGDLKLPR